LPALSHYAIDAGSLRLFAFFAAIRAISASSLTRRHADCHFRRHADITPLMISFTPPAADIAERYALYYAT